MVSSNTDGFAIVRPSHIARNVCNAGLYEEGVLIIPASKWRSIAVTTSGLIGPIAPAYVFCGPKPARKKIGRPSARALIARERCSMERFNLLHDHAVEFIIGLSGNTHNSGKATRPMASRRANRRPL